MQIFRHYSLQQLHTFRMNVFANEYLEIGTEKDMIRFMEEHPDKMADAFVLGGGSNVLFRNDFPGLVLHMNIRGKDLDELRGRSAIVSARAGEDWDGFVAWCTSRGYYGLENLSGIPGSVGACPIQNIGAYGVEVKDFVEGVEVLDLSSRKKQWMDATECRFGYRNSVFKQRLKGKVIILSVRFRLSLDPIVNLGYAGLKDRFAAEQADQVAPVRVREEVLAIRARKLPDPKLVGNAGSFFKNPVVSEETYQDLAIRFSGLPYFAAGQGKVKLPAGWLIEQCGWKGFRNDDAGVWDRQALVLCNYGKASPGDILRLAGRISKSVEEKFGIRLEAEVNII